MSIFFCIRLLFSWNSKSQFEFSSYFSTIKLVYYNNIQHPQESWNDKSWGAEGKKCPLLALSPISLIHTALDVTKNVQNKNNQKILMALIISGAFHIFSPNFCRFKIKIGAVCNLLSCLRHHKRSLWITIRRVNLIFQTEYKITYNKNISYT